MLLFVLSGLFLLRFDTRAFLVSLFHEPPRSLPVPTRTGGLVRCKRRLFLLPSAQKPTDFIAQAGGMFILFKAEKVQFLRQTQIKTHSLQLNIGAAQLQLRVSPARGMQDAIMKSKQT